MKQLLVVFHSQSGSTEVFARAAADGAKEFDVALNFKRAMSADVADLIACDAVLFATPENFGTLAGGMKDFLDRTYYPALPLELNCAYGVMVSAGNDGAGAVRQLQRIVSGFPMRLIAPPLVLRGGVSEQSIDQARELGQTMAAGLELGIF